MINKQKLVKTISLIIFVLALSVSSLAFAIPWNSPPASPPPADCPADNPGCNPPVNVGTDAQIKPGFLDLKFLGLNGVDYDPFLQLRISTEGKLPAGDLVKNWLIPSNWMLHIFGAGLAVGQRVVQIWDNLRVQGTVTVGGAKCYVGYATCYLGEGTLGHCTDKVDSRGHCNCAPNTLQYCPTS